MTDYQSVRLEAKRKGPLGEGNSAPIPILPTTEFSVTRLIPLPVMGRDKKVVGLYMMHPAVVTVTAWSSAQASSRADDITFNYRNKAWGQGQVPWDGSGKVNWLEVPTPQFTEPLYLR